MVSLTAIHISPPKMNKPIKVYLLPLLLSQPEGATLLPLLHYTAHTAPLTAPLPCLTAAAHLQARLPRRAAPSAAATSLGPGPLPPHSFLLSGSSLVLGRCGPAQGPPLPLRCSSLAACSPSRYGGASSRLNLG